MCVYFFARKEERKRIETFILDILYLFTIDYKFLLNLYAQRLYIVIVARKKYRFILSSEKGTEACI